MNKALWLDKPKLHNYGAAASYLSLIYNRKKVDRMITKLIMAKIVSFKAKDIFRASGLSLLGISNSNVQEFKQKIKSGEKISPILLIRDTKHGKVIIADGYHRMCAVYSFNEDEDIPCQIASKVVKV